MTLHLTPVQVLAVVGALLVLVLVWRASSRAARRAADTAKSGARLMSLTSRVVLTAVVIVLVQWVVIAYPADTALLWVVLGLPALLASYTLTRALTVTTSDLPHRKGGRR